MASFLTPTLAFAQTTPATTQDVADLQASIRALLIQLINQLQAQIIALQEKQDQNSTILGAIQSRVDAVVANNTVTSASSAVVATPSTEISAVTYACDGTRIKVVPTISGDYSRGLFHLDEGRGVSGTNWNGGSYWNPKNYPSGFVFYTDEAGVYKYTITLFDSANKELAKRSGDIDVPHCVI